MKNRHTDTPNTPPLPHSKCHEKQTWEILSKERKQNTHQSGPTTVRTCISWGPYHTKYAPIRVHASQGPHQSEHALGRAHINQNTRQSGHTGVHSPTIPPRKRLSLGSLAEGTTGLDLRGPRADGQSWGTCRLQVRSVTPATIKPERKCRRQRKET